MATISNEMPFNSPAVVEAETYDPKLARVISLTQPSSAAAEQYRILRYRLECLARSGFPALAFTSPQSGDGKTTTVTNAALALGRGGRNRVVLVDADLRHPGVAPLLGLRTPRGLCDVVAGRAALDDCLWRFGADELYVLPAGQPPDDIATTLYDPRLGDLMTALKRRFDFVLVDTPPVLPLADVPTLCRDLDGAIMVVRADHTSRDLIDAAMGTLFGVMVHGLVLNAVDPRVATLLPVRTGYDGEPQRALPARS